MTMPLTVFCTPCHQALDALSVSLTAELHDDMQVILLTYSNRIGIHKYDLISLHLIGFYLHPPSILFIILAYVVTEL